MATRRFALIKQVTSLDDLSGVDTSGASSGDTLVWNGSEWVPGDHGDLGGLSDNDHPQYLLAASYTAADVLAKLLTVDGAGSGLDADLLDGLSSASFALAARNLTAGAGLTGGGDLSADRTFAVGAGTGISVAADTVAVDQSFSPTWTGAHTFDQTIQVNGNLFAESSEPSLILSDEDEATNGKKFLMRVAGSVLSIAAVRDDLSRQRSFINVTRSPTDSDVTNIDIGSASSGSNPTINFLGSGLKTFDGNAKFNGNVAFNGKTPAAPPDYTVTNAPSADRTIDGADAAAATRNVVITLILDLIDIGILQ